MNRQEAILALGLHENAEWSAIEAALHREIAALGRGDAAHRDSAEYRQRNDRLAAIRKALFGEFGLSPALESVLAADPARATGPEEEEPASTDDVLAARSAPGQGLSADDAQTPAPDDQAQSDEGGSPPADTGPGRASQDLPGTGMLGRYSLQEKVLSSSLATVWLGLDTRDQENVLVKRFHRPVAADDREGLEVELRSLDQIDHERVSRVLDFFFQGKNLVVVTEVPGGNTLSDELRYRGESQGRYSVPQAVELLDQGCDALTAVHRKTYLGGISPDSIWVAGDGSIKLDLTHGHAFRKYGLLGGASETAGSAPYIAPEELNPDEQADHRADQYGLASVVYELLSGGHFQDLRRPLRDFNKSVPEDMSAAVMRSLSTSVRKRFPSTGAFWRACIKQRRRVPVSTYLLPAACAGLVLAVTLGYMKTLYPEQRPRYKRDQAIAAAESAKAVVHDQLVPAMSRSRTLRAELGRLVNSDDGGRRPDELGAVIAQRFDAWENRAWSQALEVLPGGRPADVSSEGPLSRLLQTAKQQLEEGQEALVAKQDKRAANQAFERAGEIYSKIASLGASPEGSDQATQGGAPAGGLLGFYQQHSHLLEQEISLLASYADFEELDSRKNAFYGEDSSSENGTDSILLRRSDYWKTSYQTRWDASQHHLDEKLQGFADSGGEITPGVLFEIARCDRLSEEVLEQHEGFKAAYYQHINNRVGDRSAEAEKELTLAEESLSLLEERLSAESADNLPASGRARRWTVHQYSLIAGSVGEADRRLKLLRREGFDPAMVQLRLSQDSQDATESDRLDWLSDANKRFRTTRDAAARLRGDLREARQAIGQAHSLGGVYYSILEQRWPTTEKLRWWKSASETAPPNKKKAITRSARVIEEVLQDIDAAEKVFVKLDGLGKADSLGQLNSQYGRLLDEAEPLSNRAKRIVEDAESRSDSVQANAISFLTNVESRYEDTVARLDGEIDTIQQDVNEVEAREREFLDRLSEPLPKDPEGREKEERDRARMRDQIARVDSKLPEKKAYLDALERARWTLMINPKSKFLREKSNNLINSSELSGARAGQAFAVGEDLNDLIDEATEGLEGRTSGSKLSLLLSELPPRVASKPVPKADPVVVVQTTHTGGGTRQLTRRPVVDGRPLFGVWQVAGQQGAWGQPAAPREYYQGVRGAAPQPVQMIAPQPYYAPQQQFFAPPVQYHFTKPVYNNHMRRGPN